MPALARYFVATFAWTWTCWWGAVLTGRAFPEPPTPVLLALGGIGPFFGALLTIRGTNRTYRRDFVRRLSDPRRIPTTWWLALAAVAVLPALAGYLVASAFGRAPVQETDFSFGAILFVVGFALAAGAVEEPGWRGAALDLLQTRMSPAAAATLIGFPWALWHFPLFFLEGSYQHGLGFGSTRFWLYNLFVLPLSVLYVWLCNGSRGSILVAIVAHAGTNIAGSMIPANTFSHVVTSGVTLFGAATVIWLTRADLHLRARAPMAPS